MPPRGSSDSFEGVDSGVGAIAGVGDVTGEGELGIEGDTEELGVFLWLDVSFAEGEGWK